MHDDCFVEQPVVCNSTRPRTDHAPAKAAVAETPAEDVFVDVQEDMAEPGETAVAAAVKKTEHAVIA
jgi:hypothetical protein